jgi:integrase
VQRGSRAGDLLKVKVGDVRHMKVGGTLTIRESKTQKDNILAVNKSVHKALREYLDQANLDDEDSLFASRKGHGPLQSQAVSKLVKKWTRAIHLEGSYGAHSLRKTWGYIQRTMHGVGFEIICKRYNHSSPAITMRYLGLQDKEVHSTLMNEVG